MILLEMSLKRTLVSFPQVRAATGGQFALMTPTFAGYHVPYDPQAEGPATASRALAAVLELLRGVDPEDWDATQRIKVTKASLRAFQGADASSAFFYFCAPRKVHQIACVDGAASCRFRGDGMTGMAE